MHPLARFSVDDLVELSRVVREIGSGAATMVEVAQRITDHLFTSFVDDDGASACVSVRLYKTHRVSTMTPALRDLAEETAGGPVDTATRALVLMGATDRADMPPHTATDRVRPLTPDALDAGGLLLNMIEALGLDLSAVVGAVSCTSTPTTPSSSPRCSRASGSRTRCARWWRRSACARWWRSAAC
jgi:hypothetical protein